jgi:hypothetical protein
MSNNNLRSARSEPRPSGSAAGSPLPHPRGSERICAFERQVVQRLDGAHDRPALLKVLGELVQKNELTVQFEGEAVKDPTRLASMLGEALEQQLGRLAKQSLVVE